MESLAHDCIVKMQLEPHKHNMYFIIDSSTWSETQYDFWDARLLSCRDLQYTMSLTTGPGAARYYLSGAAPGVDPPPSDLSSLTSVSPLWHRELTNRGKSFVCDTRLQRGGELTVSFKGVDMCVHS